MDSQNRQGERGREVDPVGFLDLAKKYRSCGYKPLFCRGLNSTYNTKQEYREAKCPVVRGYTDPAYTGPSDEECLLWVAKDGWIGWVLPIGTICIDAEGLDKTTFIESIFETNNIEPAIHLSNNGKHYITKNCNRLSASSKVWTKSGIPVTYRSGGKSQLILAPTNGRTWQRWLTNEELPEQLPDSLLPYDNKNTDHILNCLSWQIGVCRRGGALRGYEDLDQAFLSFLIDCELSDVQIERSFAIVFSGEYDAVRTEMLIKRTKEKKQNGETIRGSGSFIETIRLLDSDNRTILEKFIAELKRATGKIEYKSEKNSKEALNKMSSNHKMSLDDLIAPDCAFPREAFPWEIRNIIDKMSIAQNVDFELVASTVLALVGVALGNSIRVSPKKNNEVPLFVWLIIIGESGSGKTPAILLALKHIIRQQAIAHQIYKEEEKQYEEQQKQAKKDQSGEPANKPKLKQLFVSDFTIESLADVFEHDPRGVIVFNDEISGLIRGLDQYKGKGNDRQHYLELFNCGVWKVDRKTGVKFIKNTGASIIGGIQPKTMTKVFSGDFFDDGFLARFLLLNEENRQMEFNRVAISDEDLLQWEGLIDWCYERPLTTEESGFIKPQVLILIGAALDLWEEYYNSLGAIKSLLSERMRAFVPKLAGYYSLKFAGILHCIKSFADGSPVGSVINVETARNAIALTNYFLAQTIKSLKLYNTSEEGLNELEKGLLQTIQELQTEVKNGKLLLKRIREMLNSRFPTHLRLSDHSNKRLGGMLRDLGLQTEESTGGVYYLVWEENKIQSLFSRYCISTLSTFTTNPSGDNRATVEKMEKVDIAYETNAEVIDLEHVELEVLE